MSLVGTHTQLISPYSVHNFAIFLIPNVNPLQILLASCTLKLNLQYALPVVLLSFILFIYFFVFFFILFLRSLTPEIKVDEFRKRQETRVTRNTIVDKTIIKRVKGEVKGKT